jgi:hypothetical protein
MSKDRSGIRSCGSSQGLRQVVEDLAAERFDRARHRIAGVRRRKDSVDRQALVGEPERPKLGTCARGLAHRAAIGTTDQHDGRALRIAQRGERRLEPLLLHL